MSWAWQAQRLIEAKVNNLPPDATLADRKRWLREAAYSFHGGTSWGRRIWGRECRKHLEAHGQPRRAPPPDSAPLFADDIVFPFRGDLK